MVKFCMNCGAELKNDYLFCRQCGTQLSDEIPEKIQFCPECGNQIKENHVFCDSCGLQLPKSDLSTNEAEIVDDENDDVDEAVNQEQTSIKVKAEESPSSDKQGIHKLGLFISFSIILVIIFLVVFGINSHFDLSLISGVSTSVDPVADFDYSLYDNVVSIQQQSTDEDGFIQQYHWDFGDGYETYSEDPGSHIYKKTGHYTIRLTIEDDDGNTDSYSKSVQITIPNKKPRASCSASKTYGEAPLTIQFSGSGTDSDGLISRYHWDFGDGKTSSLSHPSHTYTQKGNYQVHFMVYDNDGASDTESLIIEVIASDKDDDGVADSIDNCPDCNNPDQIDTDNDGLGDCCDIDDDNDGYADVFDHYRTKNARVKIEINEFKVIDEIDGWPNDNNKAQIYFKTYVNDKQINRYPTDDDYINVNIRTAYNHQRVIYYDIPDNERTCKINIQMYDEDFIDRDDLVDIDGHDETKGLTVTYDIVTQTWSGDDSTGFTNGSNDGTASSDNNDGYLYYHIETV